MTDFEHRGTWWFHPGYLDTPPGPWGGYDQYGDDPVAVWKLALDWMADRGLNFVVAGIGPEAKDPNYHDWCFHYVLDFPAHPESRVFSPEFVSENRDMIREIFAHARSNGIAPYIHHYNFGAPFKFVHAHPELLEKHRRPDGSYAARTMDSANLIQGNVCWSEQSYKDYMIACWREFSQAIPEGEGIMVTPGEAANCSCEKCAGGQEGWNQRRRRVENHEMVIDFIKTFADTLKTVGKTPLVRNWTLPATGLWLDAMPKGVPYVFKYSGFDAVDCPPQPVVEAWHRAGHTVWVSKEFIGGENAGPIIWNDPSVVWRWADELRRIGIPGVMGIHNTDHGLFALRHKVQFAQLDQFVHSVTHDKPYDESRWNDYFTDIFGDAGAEVLQAAKLFSALPLNINKVMWERDEGFMWNFTYYFKELQGWPGTLGITLTPPEWVRGDMVTLRDYVDYLARNPWTDDVIEKVAGAKQNPFTFLEQKTECAKEGMERLEKIEPRIPENARKEFRLLALSAKMSYLTGVQWTNFLRARLLYCGATSGADVETERKLALECLECLDRGVHAMERQLEAVLRYPPDILPFHIYLQRGRGRGLPQRIQHWKRERDAAARDLEELIQAKVWRFP